MLSSVTQINKAIVEDTEQQLIDRVMQGDRKAFHSLYEQHVGKVYSLCLRLVVDPSLAEDATQEVFVQDWKKIQTFKGNSQFSTWLHSVTTFVAISYLRKQRGWFKRMFTLEQEEANQFVDEGSAGDVELEKYVQRLPEKARIVFVLHAIEGYRHEEIADMTGMALGTSKAHFHRAKHLQQDWMGYE